MNIKPNQKAYEIISTLIAAEADAINDYKKAISELKTTCPEFIPIMNDIQGEEIVHLEQLTYLASIAAGEKNYQSRNPDIKKEVDKLLSGKGPIEH